MGLGLEELLLGLGGGIYKVDTCECVYFVGGVFSLPPYTLEKRLYLLVQVQHGILC